MNPLEHVIYKLRNARVLNYPYPHFFVEDVFPDDFYWKMLARLPEQEEYAPSEGGYRNRLFADPKDDDFKPFYDKVFTRSVIEVFSDAFIQRFPDGKANLSSEWRLVRDSQGYSIGPHTDAKWKVVSLLFYLPVEHSNIDAGTSIFIPEDRQFENDGGPHFSTLGFRKVWTAPYKPNSCFGFWKTPFSWHGVDEIPRKMQRDVLLFNVYQADLQPGAKKP